MIGHGVTNGISSENLLVHKSTLNGLKRRQHLVSAHRENT